MEKTMMTDERFQEIDKCPQCFLNGRQSNLKAMPLLDAKKSGYVTIDSEIDPKTLRKILFAVCPTCGFKAFPECKDQK